MADLNGLTLCFPLKGKNKWLKNTNKHIYYETCCIFAQNKQKISCTREIKNKFSFPSLALSCIKVNDTSLTR